jgi:hypothetical protein
MNTLTPSPNLTGLRCQATVLVCPGIHPIAPNRPHGDRRADGTPEAQWPFRIAGSSATLRTHSAEIFRA